MDLPIRFPKDEDVIAEEAALFRGLSPASRLQSIRSVIDTGDFLMKLSPNKTFLRDYDAGYELESRHAIQEFIARYAR